MITSLHLLNFKPFANQLLAFKKLTLFSGLNSTGKSSVMQSLLLLRQSYQQGLSCYAFKPLTKPVGCVSSIPY